MNLSAGVRRMVGEDRQDLIGEETVGDTLATNNSNAIVSCLLVSLALDTKLTSLFVQLEAVPRPGVSAPASAVLQPFTT